MSDDKDGGPAFPIVNSVGAFRHAGMSLRDYFAGQALMGALANQRLATKDAMELTRNSYLAADAMLEARKA